MQRWHLSVYKAYPFSHLILRVTPGRGHYYKYSPCTVEELRPREATWLVKVPLGGRGDTWTHTYLTTARSFLTSDTYVLCYSLQSTFA